MGLFYILTIKIILIKASGQFTGPRTIQATPRYMGLVPCLVCCSVLQCVAVCCSVLQCVAVCWSVLQCVAVCCSGLKCVQCVAVCVWLSKYISTYVYICLYIHRSPTFF